MERIDLMEKVRFVEEFAPLILRRSDEMKVPLICMEPGQQIPTHPGGRGVFYIISGTGVMTVDGPEHEISAGNLIFIEPGESRGIRATDQLIAFAVHVA